jgi:polyphosphate kinase 2 (PPK2 family)
MERSAFSISASVLCCAGQEKIDRLALRILTVTPNDNLPLDNDWLEAELQDTLDEDYEIELEDALLSLEIKKIYQEKHQDTLPRREYFINLLKLQAELIKMHDWVQHAQAKVLVIFEGRDSAGKGGVIKRITQRLNPRVCRVVALPKPSEREQTQWYFQR